jgi:hypothetical protein
MAKLTLTTLSGGYASVTAINNNNADIVTAIENTLSRDGTTPNTMAADFDLNDNDLLNGKVGNFSAVTIAGVSVVPGSTLTVPNASAVPNTPAGGIAATDVQAAINELDTEKLAKASNLSDVADAATALANLGGVANSSTPVVIRKYTAGATWTKPAGLRALRVVCIAGGGGGGSVLGATSGYKGAGSGGGGGAYGDVVMLPTDVSSTVAVTVGAGGAAEVAGGQSSFGAYLIVPGGYAGAGPTTTATTSGATLGGTNGGSYSGPAQGIRALGGDGHNGIWGTDGTYCFACGGNGGDSMFGGGGRGGMTGGCTGTSTAENANGWGCGGGGACSMDGLTDKAGGAGGNGIVIVYEYY